MILRINGRLAFTYGCPKKQSNKLTGVNFKLSLLGFAIGIFLLPQVAYLSTITPEKLIELTNLERQAAGLNLLTANQSLTQAAILKGEAIFETNTFKHTINDKKFSAWVRDTGYNYSYVGENLAIDFATSEGVIEAWKNSPLHKKNLLNPYYQEIGISAAPGKFQGQDTIVVVQVFGAPALGSAVPIIMDSGLNLNSNFISPEINLSNWQANAQTENLLSHSVISQELLPLYNNKLALAAYSYEAGPLNKFIIQSDLTAINNFLITFGLISLIYLLIFLYYYYFLKINKLISAQL
ncbi:MAG: CAP domain-containing protein [bacterium]|nr:CAP domain-containing protein [bacterium]